MESLVAATEEMAAAVRRADEVAQVRKGWNRRINHQRPGAAALRQFMGRTVGGWLSTTVVTMCSRRRLVQGEVHVTGCIWQLIRQFIRYKKM